MRLKIAAVSLLLFCSSCGYRIGYGDLPTCYCTIEVPYVDGDKEGDLTSQIIERLSQTATFRYVPSRGDLVLRVKILQYSNENIGFRYDEDKSDQLTKTIIPVETRQTVLVQVEVLDKKKGCLVLGPVRMASSVEFDHDYYGPRGRINEISLGQLTDIDEAFDSALHPLNRNLAEKIVDYVIHSW